MVRELRAIINQINFDDLYVSQVFAAKIIEES